MSFVIRWSLFITGNPSLPFLLFILYSIPPDSLWCDSSPTTYTAKRKTTLLVVECYTILSGGISLVYVTGISNERLQQAGLSSGTERISLSLPPPFSLSSFPAFHDSALKWQKLCASCLLTEVLWGEKRIEGWWRGRVDDWLFVCYTTFPPFTPTYSHIHTHTHLKN